MSKIRIKIAQRAVKMQNMINITACLETKDHVYYDDVIYLEFCRGASTKTGSRTYDTSNSLSFKYTSLALRELAYSMNEIINTKKTSYIKIAEPRLSGTEGNRKTLSLGVNQKDDVIKYFINAKQEGDKNIALSFFNYELNAIMQLLSNIADLVDDKQFEVQRFIDKNYRKSVK